MVADVTLRVKFFYAVTLALNLFCSRTSAILLIHPHVMTNVTVAVVIAWKIWSIHRHLSQHSVSGVRFVGIIAVIVESGESSAAQLKTVHVHFPLSALVYTALLIVLIVTSVVASTAMFIVLNAVRPPLHSLPSTHSPNARPDLPNHSKSPQPLQLRHISDPP